jgi:hypothetical protein
MLMWGTGIDVNYAIYILHIHTCVYWEREAQNITNGNERMKTLTITMDDENDCMQWLRKVMPLENKCYAKNAIEN